MLRTLAKVWGGVLGVVWILFIACGDIADFDRFLSLQRGEKCGVHPLSLLSEDASFSPLGTSCISPTLPQAATRLFVYESSAGGARATVYNIESISDGENAINVLGQSNYTSNTQATTQSGVSSCAGGQQGLVQTYLFVGDLGNRRVMIWDIDSITDGENATYVLGQANFTNGTGAVTQSRLGSLRQVAYDSSNNRLFVADRSAGNRVMVFDVTTISNGENAVNVLGQSNFTSSTAATTQSGMSTPYGVAYDSTNNRLFVADDGNNRILVFDVSAISDGEDAVNVLGQPDFTSGSANQGGSAGQATLSLPQALAYGNNKLYVVDQNNNRVLVFDVTSITDGEDAVNVLGQPDFTTTSTGTTAAKMNAPEGIGLDVNGNRLFVAEYSNARVSIFDVSSITDGENAVNVLGQSSFTTSTCAVTQAGMCTPDGIALK